jgi:hypothetical protein
MAEYLATRRSVSGLAAEDGSVLRRALYRIATYLPVRSVIRIALLWLRQNRSIRIPALQLKIFFELDISLN